MDLRISEAQTRFNTFLFSGLFLLVLAVFLGIYLTRYMITYLNELSLAADKISTGRTDVTIESFSNDELGMLSKSFERLVENAKLLSQSALQIGEGNYQTDIPVRSESDSLGQSLVEMRNRLDRLSQENKRRNWLLSGNSEFNDVIRGDKTPADLAQEAIVQLCAYLNAQIGAIYLNDGGDFKLFGSYAFDLRKGNTNVVKTGEGLLGQAILEKKTLSFTDIPDDYLLIKSGLGSSIPRNLIAFPILFNGEVVGIMEFASFNRFSEQDLELLTMVGENLGIAVNSAFSRVVTRELLEETQRQAEELETQQEELRQTNEELTEKTELLLRSEAELKTQQEELQQTNEELEEKANLLQEQKEKLENASNELETKAKELEITSKYKSEFLANMSHELRTPLNSILILSQMMAENKSNQLAEKEVEFARNIYSSGTDLLALINEILDLSKVESGKMELDVEPVLFTEIFTDINSMFLEVAKNKNIEFKLSDQGLDSKDILTDRLRLNQILRNLLSNAFKFTPKDGKVSLEISTLHGGIRFKNRKLQQAEQVVQFKVKDTGIGIPDEKLDIIFEAFQQADGSTKRKYGGTGLGLSISRELAIALGGEITVSSREGKGTEFSLFLPQSLTHDLLALSSENRDSSEEGTGIKISKLGSGHEESEWSRIDDRNSCKRGDKTVLILEDDPDFAGHLLEFVRERGFKGIVSGLGKVAFQFCVRYNPMAILLDLKLPDISGEEILKQLKEDPILKSIPVQVISGLDKKKESLSKGAFDFLMKPASKEDLRKVFDRMEAFLQREVKKILVIEDNQIQSSAIKSLLQKDNVLIIPAYSGKEALEVVKSSQIDCIIIDLGLPDISGFDLIESLRKDPNSSQVPIIVYTGKELTKAEHQLLQKLANKIVIKTVESKDRLLDETMLFLHRVESGLPKEKRNLPRNLHKSHEVLRNKKVLLVDDDIRNIYSLTNLLEEEGMHCLTAENGKDAIQVLNNNEDVDLVLMDIMMPEMDGFEATRIIKNEKKYAKLPIIALTAKAMKGDKEQCLKAGMSDYISKPVDIEQLFSLLRVWLYK